MDNLHTNMPILKDFRGVNKITLSQYEGSEIEVFDSILFSSYGQIEKLKVNDKDTIILMETMPLFIKSWNFSDEAGNTLPINLENITLLKPEAIKELAEKIGKVIQDKKKD